MTDFHDPLPPEQLRKRCDARDFSFGTTDELPDIDLALGQDRALEALEFGLGISQPGFNIFALGPSGLGKTSAVREVIARLSASQLTPDDWCYVYNFAAPAKPRALRLPAGQGRRFVADIEGLIGELSGAIPAAFESEEYRSQAEAIEEAAKDREAAAVDALRQESQKLQIALIETPTGYAFAPIDEQAEVLSPDAFQQLPAERQETLREAIGEFHERLQKILRQFPAWRRESQQKLKALNRETAGRAISQLLDELAERYATLPDVAAHLDGMRQTLMEHADEFLPQAETGVAALFGQSQFGGRFLRYRVNLLVDHGDTHGAPLIVEPLPHHANLIGRVEHQAHMGTLVTDFTMIRAGALHRANGGYLVLDALKLLTQPFAWESLKRALQAAEIRIEPLERTLSLISTASLEPEPIPLRVKVVLTGDRLLYYLLSFHDPEFQELFKVPADFEDTLDRDAAGSARFARFIASLARRDGLRPLERDAVMAVIEQAARGIEDAEKLDTHLGRLGDLLKEADHWAGQADRKVITRVDVETAIDRHLRRASRMRDELYENIRRGTLLIDTTGRTVGQVNGLSVVLLGDTAFGHPMRITATTRLGSGKIVDIERETELGGAIHSKGVMILSAFLAWRYARIQPLSLAASLVFEQSYGEVEGDSASLAELCALLSSLAELPVRQELAITGSVNQLGLVQPIGGVNEKIEGFFDVCRESDLTGRQGVIIPRANQANLMLRDDLVTEAAAGRFQVHAVSTVDEALALLLDTAAGERDDSGEFPAGSVNGRVEAKLRDWAMLAVQLNQGGNDE
jgi:lon-related putative ATP-dependent protease